MGATGHQKIMFNPIFIHQTIKIPNFYVVTAEPHQCVHFATAEIAYAIIRNIAAWNRITTKIIIKITI